MSILVGTTLLPPAYNQPEAGKLGALLCTFTGATNKSPSLATNGTFVIAAIGANQTVTLSAAWNGNVLAAGNLVDILDGSSHEIIGQVVSTSGLTAVIKTVTIPQGAAGNTMATAAVVAQVSNAAFVAAAAGSNQAVSFATATQASLFAPGDTIGLTDGTTTIVGTVASVAGPTVNVTTVSFSAGAAGNTVAQYAKATDTLGDRIVFSGDPLNYFPAGAILLASQIIIPGSTGGLTASVGYASQDGDLTNSNFTYFNSATAVATAGRFGETGTNIPVQLSKPAWPTLQLAGANAPNAQYVGRFTFLYPGPPIAQR